MIKSEVESYIELEKLEDLVKIIAVAQRSSPIYYVKLGNTHVYFLPATLGFRGFLIYFIKTETEVKEKYIIYDAINDKISFSNETPTKPSLSYFIIVKVKAQNVLPKVLK